MHLPSQRVRREMFSEESSIWVVPANGGEEIAILVKCPTPAIKAIIEGCAIEIIVGINDKYLCIGLRIYDVPDSPFFISKTMCAEEEHETLKDFLKNRTSPIFLFNEMDTCLAWSNISISGKNAQDASALIKGCTQLYDGSFNLDCSYSLDSFCYSVYKAEKYSHATEIPISIISPEIEPWRANSNIFIGLQESNEILINNKNEGETFERAIWASLEFLFPLTLQKGPLIKIGEKTREFTDIMAYYEYGTFLIEAKDVSVLQAGFSRSMERRKKGIEKQIKKAIGQLIGSYNALKRGERIYSSEGSQLDIERQISPHCIVLVTELMHTGDWSEIEEELLNAIESTETFFHILDLRELVTLVKDSAGDPAQLDYNLLKRFEKFIECGSIDIRFRPTSNIEDF